jgi:hypothetical protein
MPLKVFQCAMCLNLSLASMTVLYMFEHNVHKIEH